MATYLDRRAEVEAAYARGLRGLAEDKPREDKRWLFGMGVSTSGARIDSCQHLSSAVDAYNRVLASTRELADAHEELSGTIRRIKESTEKGTLRSQALFLVAPAAVTCAVGQCLVHCRSAGSRDSHRPVYLRASEEPKDGRRRDRAAGPDQSRDCALPCLQSPSVQRWVRGFESHYDMI